MYFKSVSYVGHWTTNVSLLAEAGLSAEALFLLRVPVKLAIYGGSCHSFCMILWCSACSGPLEIVCTSCSTQRIRQHNGHGISLFALTTPSQLLRTERPKLDSYQLYINRHPNHTTVPEFVICVVRTSQDSVIRLIEVHWVSPQEKRGAHRKHWVVSKSM